MKMMIKRSSTIAIKCSTLAIGGMCLLSPNQNAQASDNQHRLTFQEFRKQHADLSRHVLRHQFRAERRDLRDSLQHTAGGAQSNNSSALSQAQNNNHINNRHHGVRDVNNRVFNQSLQILDTGRTVRLNNGIDLDLTSEQRNITIGKNLLVENVQLTEGKTTRSVGPGSQVSAAEFIAIKQMLATGNQSIEIDKSGRAVGGQVDLDAITSNSDVMRARNLVVASNVTTSGDFGKRSDFRLNGDLTNFGTVLAFSSDNNVRGGAIRADDISNHVGAQITSNVGLTLDANRTLSNQGEIVSAGDLTLIAGNGINNSGLLRSHNGNITLDGSGTSALLVDNRKGTIDATNGAINIRNDAYTGTASTQVRGGDLFSKEVNLHAGQGTVDISVNQLTGTINGTGSAAHVEAATDTLSLGSICLTGDPTVYNTKGDITVTADLTVGENLVLVASKDILVNNGVSIRADDGANGANITFIAGASFSTTGGADASTVPPVSTPGGVVLSGKSSSTGGGIIFGTSTKVFAQSATASPNADGGNIELFAFGGKSSNAGVVNLSGATLNTGGKGTGADGDVTIIAAGSKKDAIILGIIDATGGAQTTGDVNITTANIISSDKKVPVAYDSFGNLASSSHLIPATKANKGANIIVQNSNLAGDDIKASNGVGVVAGGELRVAGQINSSKNAELISTGLMLKTSPTGLVTAGNMLTLNSSSDIGTFSDTFDIDTPKLFANSTGNHVILRVLNAGAGTLTILGGSAKEFFGLEALQRTVSSSAPIVTKSSIYLQGTAFGKLSDLTAKTELDLYSDSTITNSQFSALNTSRLLLHSSAGSIGTSSVNPFVLPTGVTEFGGDANVNAYVTNSSGKSMTVVGLTAATGELTWSSNAGTEITNDLSDFAAAGDVNILQSVGTLLVGGVVRSANNINIIHSGNDKKSKIVFAKLADVHTEVPVKASNGNIVISVGANNPNPVPLPTTVQKIESGGGIVTATGFGMKAKGPTNILNAEGANVKINNGIGVANLSFGGGVIIHADPPVDPSAPVHIEYGTSQRSGSQLATVTGATSYSQVPNLLTEKENADGSGGNLNGLMNTLLGASSNNSPLLETDKLFIRGNNRIDSANLRSSNFSYAEGSGDSYALISCPDSLEHNSSICSDLNLGLIDGDTTPGCLMQFAETVKLDNGSSLFVPSRDMKVLTPHGEVHLAAGSITMIAAGPEHLAVFDLHDRTAGGVRIESAGKSIALSPGRHITLAAGSAGKFADVNVVEAIPHRQVSRTILSDGRAIFSSEFSIPESIRVISPIKSLMVSKTKEARLSAYRLLKTAAVVNEIGKSSQPFEIHAKQKMIAIR